MSLTRPASYVTNKAKVDRALTDVNRKIEEHSLTQTGGDLFRVKCRPKKMRGMFLCVLKT